MTITTNKSQTKLLPATLTATERQKMLVEWNDNWTDYPQDWCIHQLFEAQVERTPEAITVIFEGEQMTYNKLNKK